mmetsp:Transcript_3534/g.6533  ORF Transcript_3534/g.6533 Transcript_3534/m.6533 type:complete len:350 (+) Transcript_3534:125-1174(+)
MKRISKEDEIMVAQVALLFKIPSSTDIYEWCELGERWEERDDTSENVVTIKLGKRNLGMPLLTAWPAVSELPRLSEIRLDHNDLLGGFPQNFPPHLERLYLDHNPRLGGSLPQGLRYRKLSVLWLGSCGLEGPLPYGIGELWALKQLVLNDNNLTGRLPDSWATLPVLEVVDLRQNKFKGSLPRSLSQLRTLVQLDLSFNQFSGEVPTARLSPLHSLQWLNLTHCKFSDTAAAQRELAASLPNAVVRIHVAPKPFAPSEKPTFPPAGTAALSQYASGATPINTTAPDTELAPGAGEGTMDIDEAKDNAEEKDGGGGGGGEEEGGDENTEEDEAAEGDDSGDDEGGEDED